MINIEKTRLNQLKVSARDYYQSIVRVYCPYLKMHIKFNSMGFNHLLNKSWGHSRTPASQYTRLRLLPLAVYILEKSGTLQEFDSRVLKIRKQNESRWLKIDTKVDYYVFTSLSRNRDLRAKIVVKQVGEGEVLFYSLYPAWKTRREAGKYEKIFYLEDLEQC